SQRLHSCCRTWPARRLLLDRPRPRCRPARSAPREGRGTGAITRRPTNQGVPEMSANNGSPKKSLEELQKYYQARLHAMQSGAAMPMQTGLAPTSPKHLRVGVNAAMCDHSALVQVLIAKGLLTWEEYYTALCQEMDAEVKRYEVALSLRHDANITLG